MYVQNDDGDTIRNYRIERVSTSHNIKSAVSYHSYGSRYIIPGSDFATPWNQESYDYLLNNLSSIGYQGCIQNCTAGSFIDWAYYNHGVFSLAVQLNSDNQGGVEGGFHANPVLIQPTSRMHLLTNIEILDDYSFMNNYTHTIEEVILGCIDTKAVNYNSKATIDDENCKYAPIANADVGELNRLSTTEGPATCKVWRCFTAGSTIQFNGTATDEDGFIVLYEWDFDGDGVYEWSSSDNGQTTKIYNSVNLYKAVLKVTDNDGFTDTDSVILTIAPADEDESSLPSVSLIFTLVSIGLMARYRRK